MRETPLVFSVANSNAIEVSDALGDGLEVTLAATNGTLTLGSLTGVQVVTGTGTNDETVTLRGSASAITGALNGLRYTPKDGFSGRAEITVGSRTRGTIEPATASVAVTVVAPSLRLEGDPGGDAVTDTGEVTLEGFVDNVIPQGLMTRIEADPEFRKELDRIALTGLFRDPGEKDKHWITIDWGEKGVPPVKFQLDETNSWKEPLVR